jgi:hypothetical protein
MQFLLTAVILFCALCYAFWRIYDAFRNSEGPCKDCELKKNCKKFGDIKDNSYLCNR